MATNQKLTGVRLIRSIVLVFSAFLFALIVNSFIIHEAGHAFGGVLFGCKFEGLHINPFGTGGWSSRCPDPLTMTPTGRFLQGMGGPIFGLPLSIGITLILWGKRKPILLPFLMSAPVALIGNFVGVIDSIQNYPRFIFDYGWAITFGVPTSVIWVIGISSFLLGMILMNLLLPLAGIGTREPFWKIFVIHLSTWPLYFLLRVIVQSTVKQNLSGPISVFIFGLLISLIAVLTFKPTLRLTQKLTHTEPIHPSNREVWLTFGLTAVLTIWITISNSIWFV